MNKSILICTVVLQLFFALAGIAEEKKPNIIIYFPDQWRRQALGFMNEDPVKTPHIDAFAQNSMVFTKSVTTSPVCTPARGALMTGKYPPKNGVVNNYSKISAKDTSIAEALKQGGYSTGYIGKWHLEGYQSDSVGFVAPERRMGFDYWYAYNHEHWAWIRSYFSGENKHYWGYGWEPDHETDKAIEFIDSHKDSEKPFALVVCPAPPHNSEFHTREQFEQMDPHNHTMEYHKEWGKKKSVRSGLIAPEEFEAPYKALTTTGRDNYVPRKTAKADMAGYYGAIASLDENFGRLMAHLKETGLDKNTIVVFSSDHGEMLSSHNQNQKQIWYEESIAVPFIISHPGQIKPGKSDALIATVDVMPTLLGLAGVEKPAGLDGTDFSPLLRESIPVENDGSLIFFCGNEDSGRKFTLHGKTREFRGFRAIKTDRYTFVMTEMEGQIADTFYYDNQADPYQLNPLDKISGDVKVFNDLNGRLTTKLTQINDSFPQVDWAAMKQQSKSFEKSILEDSQLIRLEDDHE